MLSFDNSTITKDSNCDLAWQPELTSDAYVYLQDSIMTVMKLGECEVLFCFVEETAYESVSILLL